MWMRFFFLRLETTAHKPKLISYFFADMACRTGVIFFGVIQVRAGKREASEERQTRAIGRLLASLVSGFPRSLRVCFRACLF